MSLTGTMIGILSNNNHLDIFNAAVMSPRPNQFFRRKDGVIGSLISQKFTQLNDKRDE